MLGRFVPGQELSDIPLTQSKSNSSSDRSCLPIICMGANVVLGADDLLSAVALIVDTRSSQVVCFRKFIDAVSAKTSKICSRT